MRERELHQRESLHGSQVSMVNKPVKDLIRTCHYAHTIQNDKASNTGLKLIHLFRSASGAYSGRSDMLASGRRRLCHLFHSRVIQPSVLQLSQRSFSAEPAPSESDDDVTITVNPFKGHKLEPPSRDVQTNKKELLDMFEVYMLDLTLESLGTMTVIHVQQCTSPADHGAHEANGDCS